MRVLLDTCVFLWWITDDRRLSANARSVIEDEQNILVVSAATGWEIATKYAIGKLSLPRPPLELVPDALRRNRVAVLPITMAHTLHTYTLPLHHRDPFDRILVAQSQVEAIPIATDDATIAKYGVQTIW